MVDLGALKEKKQQINNNIENGNIEKAEKLIEEYDKVYKNDLDIELCKCVIDFLQKKYSEAEKKLRKLYNRFEYNYEVSCNLGIVLLHKGMYEEAAYYLLKASVIDKSKAEEIAQWLAQIPNDIYNRIEKNILEKLTREFNGTQKAFPKLLSVGKQLDLNYKDKYYMGIYDHYAPEKDGLNFDGQEVLRNCYKFEIMKAHKGYKLKFNVNEKTILPLMVTEDGQNINIKVNGNDNIMKNLIKNRYYYYTFNKGDKVSIESSKVVIFGDKIPVKRKKNKPALVLNIFIDGFSQKFLRENNFEEIAPNMYKFFSKGTICDNFYVAGDWTYVSVASFFSGKSSAHHRVFHPSLDTNNLYCQELYSEIFNKDGYFGTRIDGEWRSNPSIGYMKGINRYLYQPAVRGMKIDDVLTETIEHLRAFKDLNNFMMIYIPDLHDIADELQTGISTQIATSISGNIIEKTNSKTVNKVLSNSKIERYKLEISRVDTYLGLLFSYIENNYNDDDVIVSLFADHGQSFIDSSNRYLDERRSNAVLMMRGRNIKAQYTDELISGVDLFPIELHACGIEDYDMKEGNIPKCFGGTKEREFTYTETIYPEKPYEAVINDKIHKLFFNTKEACTVDGRIKIDEYNVILINKNTGEDESSLYPEKVKLYTNEVFKHIHDIIII